MILKFLLYLSSLTVIKGGCKDCTSFSNETDCQSVSPICQWNSNNTCQIYKGTSVVSNFTVAFETTNYCSPLSDCNLHYGCAYYNKKCTLFLGCDAYEGYSNEQCFNISFLCSYTSGNYCERNQNYDTNGNPNVTLACSDAPKYYQSQDKCKYYSSSCLYNGLTCVDHLSNCDQYSNTSSCSNLIGLDGKCQQGQNLSCKLTPCSQVTNCDRQDCYLNNGNCVERKVCQGDAKSLSDCNFTESCYFNGTQCTESKNYCSDYSADTCNGTYGMDGPCIVVNNLCRRQECSQIAASLRTFYCQTLKLCSSQDCYYLNQTDCILSETCNFDTPTQKCRRKTDPCELYSYTDCPSNCNYNNSMTINKQECTNSLSETECKQNIQPDSNIPCFWDQDLQICQQATECEQLTNVDNQVCKRFSSTCQYDSTVSGCADQKYLECQERGTKAICLLNNDCYWSGNQCISTYFDCESIEKASECFVNIYQYPCVWNQTLSKCLRYHERDPYISQYTCESISNKWEYRNNSCQLKQKCSVLNYTGQGFEGDCDYVFHSTMTDCSQIGDKTKCEKSPLKCVYNSTCQPITSCGNLTDSASCNKYQDKCIYRNGTCQAKICSDLTQCQPIKGFSLDSHYYCKPFGSQCLQVPPENSTDCFLYSQGKYSFEDGACESCDENHDNQNVTCDDNRNARFLITNYTMLDMENQSSAQLFTYMIFNIIINL